MVLASTNIAVVLTVIAFLHGSGKAPVAASYVTPSIQACKDKAEEVGARLRKDSRVRSVSVACLVARRKDNA